jgi:arylsulfatase A-like enzyme
MVVIDFPCPIDAPLTFDERHYRNAFLTRKSEADTFSAKVFNSTSDWLRRNHTHQDFYLHVDCFDPHEPWDPPEEYVKIFDERGYDVPDWLGRAVYAKWRDTMSEDQFNHFRARYAASAVLVDKWLGELWDTLDELDLWKNTMVIFVSDHGTFNGDFGRMGKLQTHEHDACGHVPFIIYHPEYGHGERRNFQLVDLYPTILSAVGRPLPDQKTTSPAGTWSNFYKLQLMA